MLPLVAPSGFREYDARWRFPEELNLPGMRQVGRALGRACRGRHIVAGHDYRAYSPPLHEALIQGLLESGMTVQDIGLALSPTAYFACSALGVPAVAMVTASHNENGWTGLKMGDHMPLTFGPQEMARLKSLLGPDTPPAPTGQHIQVEGMTARYIEDLTNRPSFSSPLRLVVACGNGTAGVFAPEVFERLGAQVHQRHCTLDHSFPHYNPNPEDMVMMEDLAQHTKHHNADMGLAFDGDGDRCGIVDNTGRIIFSDKIGVLLARARIRKDPKAHFLADIKSTSLFATDPLLAGRVEYWITGHSHMKRRLHETGACAGFEKSGHFFFAPPFGRGYDDGLLSGIAVCELLCEARTTAPKTTLASLYDSLPPTWASPTISPACPDHKKYEVVAQLQARYTQYKAQGTTLLGQPIVDVTTVNGVRITLQDGTWGLVRASSNQPVLVVVTESPVSAQKMHAMFAHLQETLAPIQEVGPCVWPSQGAAQDVHRHHH